MAEIWNAFSSFLTDLSLGSMVVRILLAALAGGMIGWERGFHGRAAGLRTHMLVCLGAALTALIGCYLSVELGGSDPQRTGAQVMSGVGFLGAGTILLKRGNSQITGLTTAAGLWATAAIGLAIGYGLVAPAFATVFVVMLVFTVMSGIEFRLNRKRQRVFVYIEIDSVNSVQVIKDCLVQSFAAVEIQVTPPRSGTNPHVGMEALIRIPPKSTVASKIEKLQNLDHVVFSLLNV